MKIKKSEIIKCPVCGGEYLAGEIYLPDSFLGQPNYVQRNKDNEVINYFGTSINPVEHYYCDFCGSKLKIFAKTQFFAHVEED